MATEKAKKQKAKEKARKRKAKAKGKIPDNVARDPKTGRFISLNKGENYVQRTGNTKTGGSTNRNA